MSLNSTLIIEFMTVRWEVIVVMLAKKGMALFLFVLATLFLASPMATVNASKTTNDFYLKMHATAFNVEWEHFADHRRVIWHLVEEGVVKDGLGSEVGTIALDVMETFDNETGKGTVSAKYEINFYAHGEMIEGTMTGKLQFYIGTTKPPELDGKFVGYGDMHVMGDAYIIVEGMIPVVVLDGYSW